MSSQKILFVIPSLVGGGAERVFVELINHIDRDRFQPLVALFEKKGIHLNTLAGDIPVFHLEKRGRFSFFKLVMRLAGVIRREKIEVVVACMEYANIICLLARKILWRRPAVIATVHNDPEFITRIGKLGKIKKFLHKTLYPSAAEIVAVSRGVKQSLHHFFSVSEQRVRVIYNGVDLEQIARAVSATGESEAVFRKNLPLVLTCGRLEPQKNHPMLIRAFRMVVEHVDAQLLILGEGNQREILTELAGDLGLSDRVTFLGFKKNPYYYMGRCDVFALSSNAEGFANVIVEAMACGTPVVSTLCPYGPDEIINHGKNGLLVPVDDTRGLADMILMLLKNDRLRESMATAAAARVKNFTLKKMVKEYENVIGALGQLDDSSRTPTVTR